MVYVTDHLMTRSLAVMNGDKRKCVFGTFAYREGSDQPAQTHRLCLGVDPFGVGIRVLEAEVASLHNLQKRWRIYQVYSVLLTIRPACT